MATNIHPTREGWLQEAAEKMRPWLAEQGYEAPVRVKVSVGFPKYGAPRAIGQCWDPKNAVVQDDAAAHIFICPTIAEAPRVADVLLHELIHAVVGCECGHRGLFKKAALSVGLAGKMTATYAEEGSELHRKILALVDELGPYPHEPLKKPARITKVRPWVRLKSVNDEKYTVVISPQNHDEHGAPSDPWGDLMIPTKEEE